MPVISDLELRKRLEAHNYQVPPITELTKKVLLKKLSQLDKEANHYSKSSKLNDYSSAEEDGSSANPSPYLRRRKVTSSTTSNSTNATSTNGSSRPTSHRATVETTSTNRGRKSQLLQISDEEPEEEDEEEESNETSDSESDEDDEDEEHEISAANIALQTSLSRCEYTAKN